MDEIKKKAINNLMRRRNILTEQYNQLIQEPESYSIVGSVSVTNRKLDLLRKEIASIDEKITTLCGGHNGLNGISIKIPDYRCPYIHVENELEGNV